MQLLILAMGMLIILATILSYFLFFRMMAGQSHHAPPIKGQPIFKSELASPPTNSIKVMTLNLAHGRSDGKSQLLQNIDQIKNNLTEVAKTIQKYAPDVVSLQEADAPSAWSGNFDHVEFLAEIAGYPYHIQGEHVKGMRLAYGTAILSKFFLDEPVSVTFQTAAPLFTKGFVAATVPVGTQGEVVEIVSLHLDFARKSVRRKQADRIINIYKNRQNPLIIMGDFNTDATSKRSVIKVFMDALDLKAYRMNDNSLITFPFTRKRLDWILISKRLNYTEHQIIPEVISDHYSIVSTITLSR